MRRWFIIFLSLFLVSKTLLFAEVPQTNEVDQSSTTNRSNAIFFSQESERETYADLFAELEKEWEELEPTNLVRIARLEEGDTRLSERLRLFALRKRDFRRMEVKRPWASKETPRERRKESTDEELASARLRNHLARTIFLFHIQNEMAFLPENVQTEWYQGVVSIWLTAPYGLNIPKNVLNDRLEADGIPSSEALLIWFAENSSIADSVRDAARKQLDELTLPASVNTK